MTTATLDRPTAPRRTVATRPVTFPRVVTSEWIKLRTLRSTAWTLGITVVLMAGVSALVAWGTATEDASLDSAGLAMILTTGFYLAQLTVAVLGVLIVTGEYTTGMIRSTLTAVPTRLPALAAKALVLALAVAVTSLLGVALAYVTTMPFHDELGAGLDLSDPETLRIVLGAPLLLATIALLALAVGAIIRHSAGAIAAILGLLLVVPTVFNLIPLRLFEVLGAYLPDAGSLLLTPAEMLAGMGEVSDAPSLGPWQGFGVLAAWTVVLLAVAAVLMRRRDA